MKTKNPKNAFSVLLLAWFIIFVNSVWSQTICTDNVNTVYGFSVAGGVYPINVNTGVVGTAVGTMNDGTNAAVNANGFGYNSVNSKFYGFYRCNAGTAPLVEFVSYNVATNTTAVLATPPFGTTTKIRSGCVNNAGTGYYCMDITSTPVASLWYFNIGTNTWTKITSSFKNGATDYTTNFQSLNSGDMAFDVQGNLWMILSKSNQYALYKIASPVPTTAVASVTVQEIIPPTATPTQTGTAPNQASFTGLAFNANGVAYLTTGSGTGAANNQLYKLASVATGVVYVGALSLPALGAGDDLTSCVFTYVLPVKWLGFTTEFLKQKGVHLKWDVVEDNNVKQYYVERSANANNWQRLATVQRKTYPDPSHTLYDYTDYNYLPGKTFYRIVQEDVAGQTHESEVKQIIAEDISFSTNPNPAKDKLNIKQKGSKASQVDIYDSYGELVLSTKLNNSTEAVDISKLTKGNYFLKLSVDGIETAHGSFIKL